jgi:hypothetical protein
MNAFFPLPCDSILLHGEDALPTLIGLVEAGIAMARQVPKSIDPFLRLEKFLAETVCLPLRSSLLDH